MPKRRDGQTTLALRRALLDFQERYNRSWIIERLGYETPAQARAEQLHPAALAA
jgi:transposase InsO family protein